MATRRIATVIAACALAGCDGTGAAPSQSSPPSPASTTVTAPSTTLGTSSTTLFPHGTPTVLTPPPDDGQPYANFAFTGPTTIQPGSSLPFEAYCRWFGGRAATAAGVLPFLLPGQAKSPYNWSHFFTPPSPGDGYFTGSLTVPADAPTGQYALSTICTVDDQATGTSDQVATFTVVSAATNGQDALPTTP